MFRLSPDCASTGSQCVNAMERFAIRMKSWKCMLFKFHHVAMHKLHFMENILPGHGNFTWQLISGPIALADAIRGTRRQGGVRHRSRAQGEKLPTERSTMLMPERKVLKLLSLKVRTRCALQQSTKIILSIEMEFEWPSRSFGESHDGQLPTCLSRRQLIDFLL